MLTRRTFLPLLITTPLTTSWRANGQSPVPAPAWDISGSVNKFSVRLFGAEVLRNPQSNLLLSPLSVYVALAMTENGAAGATRLAMLKVLTGRSDIPDATVNTSLAGLTRLLSSQKGVEVAIANSIWSRLDYPLLPDFIRHCQQSFAAEASMQDFNQPESASKKINAWVDQKTRGKIRDIVNAHQIRESTAILANAIYFRGGWTNPFERTDTKHGHFQSPSGQNTVPMLWHRSLPSAYRTGPNYEGVVLPYANSDFAMCALLPSQGRSLQDLLAQIDIRQLFRVQQAPDVELKLPKFTFDFSDDLVPTLAAMGMGPAFDNTADFSRMSNSGFKVGRILHKARIEVDETGTVAAGVTAALMLPSSVRPPTLKKTLVFDRPFVVLIGDSSTGALLFAGVVREPKV